MAESKLQQGKEAIGSHDKASLVGSEPVATHPVSSKSEIMHALAWQSKEVHTITDTT